MHNKKIKFLFFIFITVFTVRVSFSQSKQIDSLETQFKALAIWEELRERKRITSRMVKIGQAYQAMGNYNEALTFLTKGEKLAIETDDKSMLSVAYITLASVNTEQGKYLLAIE